jgi:hypothetical protein
MGTREDRAADENNDAREMYLAPQIVILGKIEDLTHGNTTGQPDLIITGSA